MNLSEFPSQQKKMQIMLILLIKPTLANVCVTPCMVIHHDHMSSCSHNTWEWGRGQAMVKSVVHSDKLVNHLSNFDPVLPGDL